MNDEEIVTVLVSIFIGVVFTWSVYFMPEDGLFFSIFHTGMFLAALGAYIGLKIKRRRKNG